MANDRRDLAVLACLGLLVALVGLGNHDLWNPDEPRYAVVAREMIEGGDFFVPHLNGRLYTQKPPLLFWSMAFWGTLRGGLDETAARLPSALAGVGTLLVVFALGRLFFGRRAAWLAAAAYATNGKTIWQEHVGQIDMLLGFWVALAVLFWAKAWVEERPRLYPLFFVSAGMATLAKGPVGLLPPLLAIIAFHALERDREALRRLRIGRGLLIWAAVVLAWLGPAIASAGRGYFEEIVLRQNVTRYAEPWHHLRPFYYYLTTIPGDFFPWTLFLPAAIWAGLRLPAEKRRRYVFAALWVGVTVVFFSLSPGKRTVYVFSLFPALALLVGAGLDRFAELLEGDGREARPSRAWLAIPAALLALIATAAVAAAFVELPKRAEVAPLGADLPRLAAGVFLLLALGGGVAFAAALRRRTAATVAGVAAGMALAAILGLATLPPRLDAVKSARGLSEELLRRAAPDEPFLMYPRLDATFLYYTRRRAAELDPSLPPEAALRAFAAGPGRVWLLIQRDDLAKLAEPLPLVEVARDADLVTGYVLMTSAPVPPPR